MRVALKSARPPWWAAGRVGFQGTEVLFTPLPPSTPAQSAGPTTFFHFLAQLCFFACFFRSLLSLSVSLSQMMSHGRQCGPKRAPEISKMLPKSRKSGVRNHSWKCLRNFEELALSSFWKCGFCTILSSIFMVAPGYANVTKSSRKWFQRLSQNH